MIRSNRFFISILIVVSVVLFNIYAKLIAFNFFNDKHISNNPKTVILLSYNIHCKESTFYEKQEIMAEEIATSYADIIFLCEFTRSKCQRLDSVLVKKYGYNQYYLRYANEVFYSHLKCDTIIDIGLQQHDAKRSMVNEGRFIFSGDTISVVGVHLDSSRKDFWIAMDNRRKETDNIKVRLSGYNHSVFIVGDFNDFSGSYTLRTLESVGLHDAWWDCGYGYGGTFNSGWMHFRLDHILYDNKRFDVERINVINSNLSDHNAIVGRFIKKY